MESVTLVEVKDAGGVTTARLRVRSGEVTVGRGPTNDVVLDDEYADPVHLRLVIRPETRTTVVRDLGSTNGTAIEGMVLRGGEMEVPFGKALTIGRSTVVLSAEEATVPVAKPLPGGDRLIAYERLPLWSSLGVLVVVLTAFSQWADHAATSLVYSLGVGAGLVLLNALWAGTWALGTRVLTGRSRFRQHLAFATLVILLSLPVFWAVDVITFAANVQALTFVLDWVLGGFVVWSVVLFGHIDIASVKTRRVKSSIAVGVTTAVLVLIGIALYADPVPSQKVAVSLRSVPWVPTRLTRSSSLDDFMVRVEELEAPLRERAASPE